MATEMGKVLTGHAANGKPNVGTAGGVTSRATP